MKKNLFFSYAEACIPKLMLRKPVTGIFFVALVLMISAMPRVSNAQEWNISSDAFNALGTLTETVAVDGLTIYASSDKSVTIDANNKSIGDYSFTSRLKLGGSASFSDGTPVARVLAFDVAGDATITIAAMSSSSSADRELTIETANGDAVGTFPALGASISMESYNYVGDATTIYIYSPSSGVNVYLVKAEAATAEGLLHSYTFEDGTAADVVGDLDGTLNGSMINIADGKATVSGATGNTDGYITLDAAALALNTYSAITVEAYVETFNTANTSYTMLFYFGNNTGGNRCLWYQPTRAGNESRAETNNGSDTKTADLPGTEVDDGKLHHIAVVLSMDALKYYLDGVLVAETATEGDYISTLDNQIANIFKGPDGWADPNYNASLEELNIYNAELSAEMIASNAQAYVGQQDSRLAGIELSEGSLMPDFSPTVTTYAVALEAGVSSVNITATANFSGATVSGDGEIAFGGVLDTAEIQVVSEDLSDTTVYTIYLMADDEGCYMPVYTDIQNLIADPELTDISMWGGWGNRSIYYGPEAYCGLSSALLEAPEGGCSAALDIAGFPWKPNTTYHLNVMVKTIGGSIGFLAKASPDFGFAVDTEGEWQMVDTTFTTGASPSPNFFSFNTCDFGSTCTAAYIDNYQLYEAPRKVAYVTEDKEMAETATQPDNDPIIQMLQMDPNIDLEVMLVANDSVFDLSGYDVVIGQEPFGSGSDIWKRSGSLGMGSLTVPHIINKVYAMRAGRGFETGEPGSGGEQAADYFLHVDPSKQSHDLFKGLSFEGDSVQIFLNGYNDLGAVEEGRLKGLQYAFDVELDGVDTLALSTKAPANASVGINYLETGDSIGSEEMLAPMITMGMNFGAISANHGNNITDAGLTIWRNAVYMLAGIDIPEEAVSTEIEIELSASAGMVATNNEAGSFQITLPSGSTSVDLTVDVISGKNPEIPTISGLSDGLNTSYELKVFSAIGMDSMVYDIHVHVQSAGEIYYLSADSRGVAADARPFDITVYDALVDAGYSVTFGKKGSIFEWTPDGIVPFDYTPYTAMVISAGESSSNVNDYAKRNYPIPAVSMQPDGPRNDKWGWINRSNAAEMYVTKTYDAESAQMVVTNNNHFITMNYELGDTIMWTMGTPDSADWSGKEVKSYNLADSIPEAIPLATIPADGNTLTTMWALPAGTSVRSMNGDYDTYERVTTSSNVVFMSVFNDGLLYPGEDFGTILTRSLEWTIDYVPPVVEEGVYYSIIQKSTGLVIGADTDPVTQPAVMTPAGSDDQAFQFIPVDGKEDTYYIQNKEGMYFNKSTSSNWTTVFEENTNGLLSEWVLNGEDKSSVTFQIVANIENISADRSYLSTDDLESGSNLYCDKGPQAEGSNGEFMLEPVDQPTKVAYVTSGAEPDPISDMLSSDPNLTVDVVDGSGDYSSYDVVIGQESFGSGDGIWAEGGSLYLKNSVPMLMNKTWAWASGKAAVTSSGSVNRIPDVTVTVEPANQDNELFNGITFTDNNLRLFKAPVDGEIGLDVMLGLEISDKNTLLASASNVTSPDSAIVINDIPAGTQIGTNADDLTGARIIAFSMNYLSITDSSNITPETMTLWRNAVYMLAGMTPPDELVENPYYVAPTKVAYVTEDKTMDATAAQPSEDPIVTMLMADENLDVDTWVVSSDSVFDLSGYDVVIGQEPFGSGSDIWKRSGSLGMGSLTVPHIINKVYAMRDGRGFQDGASGSGAEQSADYFLHVDPANQTNDLFKGLSFDGDSVQIFLSGYNDLGAVEEGRLKGLQYAVDVEFNPANDPLAMSTKAPENATVGINYLATGDSIGSEEMLAPMITMAMNYGAICGDDGNNITGAGLTIWRNAVYMLAGLPVPEDPIITGINNAFAQTSEITLYPNPTSGDATLRFSLENEANVSLSVYSVSGQQMQIASDKRYVAGVNQIDISTSNMSRGIYIYRLVVDNEVYTGKLSVIK